MMQGIDQGLPVAMGARAHGFDQSWPILPVGMGARGRAAAGRAVPALPGLLVPVLPAQLHNHISVCLTG